MTTIEHFARKLLNVGGGPALDIHMVDTVAAMVCGARSAEGHEVLAFFVEAADVRSPTRNATLAQVAGLCGATRLSEFDNIHLPSGTTPAAIVVPAALVLARANRDTTPERLAAAIVAGLETMTAFGEAVEGQDLVYRGVWTTYLTAPLGTAAAAAVLLDLDAVATAHALAIALTSMAGRIGQPGTGKTARWLMAGQGASAGVAAAHAAQQGFRGDLTLLDGDWMQRAHGIGFAPGSLFRSGSVLDGLSLKPFCSAKQVVAAICGFEQLLKEGIAVDDISEVLVEVPETYHRMIDHGVTPGDRLSSATSAPYQLACIALAPDGLFDIERRELVDTPQVRALMDKVRVEIDPALQASLPARWPARVSVITPAGRHSVEIRDAPGDPGAPFDMATVRAKAERFLLRSGLEAETAETWMVAAAGATRKTTLLAELLHMTGQLLPRR